MATVRTHPIASQSASPPTAPTRSTPKAVAMNQVPASTQAAVIYAHTPTTL